MSAKLKPGYKQTEAGVIPENWEVKDLGALLSRPPTYGINAPAIAYDSRFPTYLRITDISEDGRFISESKASVAHSLAKAYVLEDGDLVFARTGASVGKSYMYDQRDGVLVFAGFLIRVKTDSKKLVPKYLKNFVHSCTYWNWIRVNSMRSGQPGVNGHEYSLLPIPLPPSIAEQEAIAEALSDADALIEGLEKLVAKKQQIKQGAMQELLTGKRRLPGFSGEWEVKRLGDLAEIVSGGTPKTNEPLYWNGGIKWCTPTDITGCPGKYLVETERTISALGLNNSGARLLPIGSLLLCSRATIGEIKIAYQEICTNQGFKSLICKPDTCNEFIYYKLLTMKSQMLERSFGSTFLEISKSNVAALELGIPPTLSEQTAIAEVLTDMDAEIAKLETKLAKARQIKQGMMQELLTGRIRLV